VSALGYARRWHAEGEVPRKERNEKGRMAWPARFTLMAVTPEQCLPSDVPLFASGWRPASELPPVELRDGLIQSVRVLVWVEGHGQAFGCYRPATGWSAEGFSGRGWNVSHWCELATPEGAK